MPTGQLHIGWSQIEITPPKKTLLQGQFHARLADTAISPLTATALADYRPVHGTIVWNRRSSFRVIS